MRTRADAPLGIRDGRALFRQYFCEALPTGDGDCDAWLWRLDDEPREVPPSGAPPRNATRKPLHFLLVTGAFAECLGEQGLPFRDVPPGALPAGTRVDTVVVGGRSGTGHNARQIADWLADHPDPEGGPLVLLGYSKGTADILVFLDQYPELARRVSAVVSLAGAVRGSPLANGAAAGSNALVSRIGTSHCAPGDRQVIHSLRPDVRIPWLAQARLPRDELLPGSTLLGYLDADHWAMTLSLEKDMPAMMHRSDPRQFPRAALLQAIVRVVEADLGREGRAP